MTDAILIGLAVLVVLAIHAALLVDALRVDRRVRRGFEVRRDD